MPQQKHVFSAERLRLKTYRIKLRPAFPEDHISGAKDSVAVRLLQKMQPSLLEDHVPLCVAVYDCPTSPIFGTDDEKALHNAIQFAFPQGRRLSCTRHLQENVNRQLTDKIGCAEKDRRKITSLIFGKDGLASTVDDLTFDIRNQAAMQMITSTVPNFTDYYTGRIVPLLQMNLQTKLATGLPSTDTPWTNNNSESENHVLKQEIQWKTQNLTDLIDSLHNVVKLQYLDLKRALIPGLGNFQLTTQTQRLATNPAAWDKKTATQKQTLFKKLLTLPILTQTNISVSSDGKLTVTAPTNGGKKQNQIKRKRAARTTTLKKPRLEL